MLASDHGNERPPASASERAALAAAFSRETGRLLRRRLYLAVGLFAGATTVFSALDVGYRPHSVRAVAWILGVQLVACLVAVEAMRRVQHGRGQGAIAAGLASFLLLFVTWTSAAAGDSAERVATCLVCLLTGCAVLLPWGAWWQLVVTLAALGGLAAAAPAFGWSEGLAYGIVALASAAVTSVSGAALLWRYRHDAFMRTAALERARAAEEEQAEINASLLHVAETLAANLGRPEILQQVALLAAESLGCDGGAVFLWDAERRAFRLQATAGRRPDVHEELAQLEFTVESMPLLGALARGEMIEIADASAQDLVPVELLRRAEVSSALLVPIVARERLVAVLAHNYRVRTGPFSERQRRLAAGIAHTAAVALENARLVQDLRAASRIKSEFVSTMSHELRTPLNVISGYTTLLLESEFGSLDESQRDTVARVHRAAIQLLELVTATLDLGRLEMGRERLTPVPVDIGELFAEVNADVETLVPSTVTLRWYEDCGPGRVVTDRLKLKTILKNLVGNALKFTSQGAVSVTAQRRDGLVSFIVADTGIGIPPQELPVIFDMFRQVDGSHTRRFGGVGLGLHIVKRLVTLLDGSIEVVSTTGSGSTFTVRLPMVTAAEHDVRVRAGGGLRGDGRGQGLSRA